LLVNTNYSFRVEINDFYNETIYTNYSGNITSNKLNLSNKSVHF
jgi:hypothetical protein